MPILGSFGAGSKGGFGRGGVPLVEGVDFLVVAGGGGARAREGGSGGGGGYVSSTAEGTGGGNPAAATRTFELGTAYTITVGAGGSGASDTSPPATQGSSSILQDVSGTLTVYGGGSTQGSPPSSTLGSGGGLGPGNTSNTPTGQITTSGQGYPGGGAGACGLSPPQCNCGGGGGAGATGQSGTSNDAGDGGAGLTSAIDSTGRAGGGGGSGRNSVPMTTGSATDGGGYGVIGPGNAGIPGTTNTGGGGGTSGWPDQVGGNGGSGIVLLKYPDTYSITFSPGVTASTNTSGGYKTTTITATSTGSETLTFG
jgi:hypothetical protein